MNYASAYDSILANAGGTFACRSGIRPVEFTDGYMVALQGKEETFPLSTFDIRDLVDYADRYSNWVGGIGYYLGAWIDGDTVYLDISMHVDSERNAIRMGRERNQVAIWDCKNGEAINV